MTHQSFTAPDAPPLEAGAQVAHLRQALADVDALARGTRQAGAGFDALDQAARISAAYERSRPVARRRFDALAQEAVTWTGAGAEALQAAERDGELPRAAAGELARELEQTLSELARILRA
jgi:hypothetical protein